MARTSTVAMKVRTGSEDSNGVLMLRDDHLVAIIVELTDEIHGPACGRWALENSFGLFNIKAPDTFGSIEQAWDWVNSAAEGTRWPALNIVRDGEGASGG